MKNNPCLVIFRISISDWRLILIRVEWARRHVVNFADVDVLRGLQGEANRRRSTFCSILPSQLNRSRHAVDLPSEKGKQNAQEPEYTIETFENTQIKKGRKL